MKFSIWLEARVHRSVPVRKEPVKLVDKDYWKKQQKKGLEAWSKVAKAEMSPEERERHDMLVKKRMAGKKKK